MLGMIDQLVDVLSWVRDSQRISRQRFSTLALSWLTTSTFW